MRAAVRLASLMSSVVALHLGRATTLLLLLACLYHRQKDTHERMIVGGSSATGRWRRVSDSPESRAVARAESPGSVIRYQQMYT